MLRENTLEARDSSILKVVIASLSGSETFDVFETVNIKPNEVKELLTLEQLLMRIPIKSFKVASALSRFYIYFKTLFNYFIFFIAITCL